MVYDRVVTYMPGQQTHRTDGHSLIFHGGILGSMLSTLLATAIYNSPTAPNALLLTALGSGIIISALAVCIGIWISVREVLRRHGVHSLVLQSERIE